MISTPCTGNDIPIALFIGSDVSSHLLSNRLVPALLGSGYRPLLYFPAHRVSRPSTLPELRELAFFERELLSTVIYPYLDRYGASATAPYKSPTQLSVAYGVPVLAVDDINAPGFLVQLAASGAQVGLSIRCYQKFRAPLIDYFHRGGDACLWNLHPGILPRYRGVMTVFRSMLELQDEISYSLHVVNEQWDGGPIIAVRPVPLRSTEAMLTAYCELADTGVPIIIGSLDRWRAGGLDDPAPQDVSLARYHSSPSRSEMDAFLARDLRLVDHAYIRALYLSKFSTPGTAHHAELSSAIDCAMAEFANR